MKKIECAGHSWTRKTGAQYSTSFLRFTATTWPFGSIHQCVVFIKYDHFIEGKKLDRYRGDIHIGLQHRNTREEAMQHAIDWIHDFQKSERQSPDQLMEECFTNWPDLFTNRVEVLDHWFFTIGNGYDWLDGALIHTSPEDHLERYPVLEEMEREREKTLALLKEARAKRGVEEPVVVEPEPQPFRFYPVSEDYSKICLVPDDVRPDWLKVSYEAACLLRDCEDDDVKQQEANRAIGSRVVADLERRFPQLITKTIKSSITKEWCIETLKSCQSEDIPLQASRPTGKPKGE